MEIIITLLNYFDLGIYPSKPVLGKKKKSRKHLWLTLLLYFGVFLGILSQELLSLLKPSLPFTSQTFGPERLLLALVIATAIFPLVFPKLFGKEKETAPIVHPANRFFLQFCVAFQNGFFWQSLLKLIAPTN